MSDAGAPRNPGKKVIIGFVVVGICLMIYQAFFTQPNNTTKNTQQSPNAVELGNNDINKITAQDKDAALTQFQKKMESFQDKQQRMASEATKRDEALRAEFRKMEQQSNAQIRTLTEELSKVREERIDAVYQGINAKDKGSKIGDIPDVKIPSGGLSFDGDFDLGPATAPAAPAVPANPYGPNYFVLKPQPKNTYKGKSGGAQGTQSESELFAEMSAPDASTGSRATDANFNEAYGSQQGQAQPVAAAQPAPHSAEEQAKKKLKDDTYEIPAFSFVEVTTLHGVACPIGANAPGSSSTSKVPARPVVLPVHGIFHGPNGVERDLGTIHLMGLCSGRRTSSSNTGRATIRVEQLSYWDASGGAQRVAATGYIVDVRDNEQDVYGKLDQASGRTLALQSAAAAAAAYSTTLSSAEFTNTSSLQNGTSTATSQLTGDATKAAVTQGIGSMFQKISERFEAEANSAIDTVLVEPGIRLRFVSDQTIRVLKPLEPFDIDASMYDTLI